MTGKTKIPGILLMVFGGIGILFAILGLLVVLVGGAFGFMSGFARYSPAKILGVGGSVVIQVIIQLLTILWYSVVAYGGLSLMNRKRYVFCWVAAILGIPICCFLGLVPGIWSIVVLLDEEVKADFEQNAY